MTLDEEKALIATIVSGDKDAFRLVITEHKDLIFRIIMKQVGDPIIADELAQEVFVKSYFGIKKFRGNAKLSTWLIRIALNETNSYFASKRFKEKKHNEQFDTEKHGSHTDESKEEQEHETTYRHSLLRAALANLTSPFRETLTLCSLEGKSYEEAAEILEIPLGTVRSRLNKARLLLKELIASSEVHHE
jgi:RNA polymerase sigma-70 factor (ECF subfamily)